MNLEPKPPTRMGPADWFTGNVYIDAMLGRKGEPSRMACGWVHPGEEHWHGAAPANFMAHIALYEGITEGDGATWLKHVSGEQYATAAAAIAESA
jgi:hypothetical protein